MKTAWVLSEEQRNQRFNKLTKLKTQNSKNDSARSQPLAISEVHMKFTIEEQKSIEELHQKFKFHPIREPRPNFSRTVPAKDITLSSAQFVFQGPLI